MGKKIELLIIDPQNDFCNPDGALFVPGADADMQRLAAFVRRAGSQISKIHVTLDSHHLWDVAHPVFWKDTEGNHPSPFTIISAQDVKDGVWLPVRVDLTPKMIEYTQALADGGRYPLCIWPAHCLIGTNGAAVYPDLMDALNEWAASKPWFVNFVSKGSNIMTEHYSAVKAEVPDPKDPSTQLNTPLINTLGKADLIGVAGEASSHCLANTARDIADYFKAEKYIKNMVLLEDATSPVASFENLQTDFIKEMTARGMQLAKTTDF